MEKKHEEAEAFLDSIFSKIDKSDDVHETMEELVCGLKDFRISMDNTEWQYFSQKCIEHPLREIVHQDPFSSRAFSKPRGYPGDAVLIDFIYRDDSVSKTVGDASKVGKNIYKYTSSAPAPCAVRERRNLIARIIDEIADSVRSPDILSIASGHLNEANYVEALKSNRIGRYVAFDQDPKSLQFVEKRFGDCDNINCIHGTIKQLIKNELQLGKFDLVYALGLFDYLPHLVGTIITDAMFGMLKPGGRILIGNFVPDIKDVGYMETYMGWKLIYRDATEMEKLAANVNDSISRKCVFIEENRKIAFLEIFKT